MSGGHYDDGRHIHTCCADERIYRTGVYQAVADDLRTEGFEYAAQDTEAFIAQLEALREQIERADAVFDSPLSWVWRALDWWKSGDGSYAAFAEAADEYEQTREAAEGQE